MNAPTFCECCRNTGYVTIFSPWTVAGLLTGRKTISACGATVRTHKPDGRVNWQGDLLVPCKCDAGDRHLVRLDFRGNVRPWNGQHDSQHRFGDKWWHVRVPDPNAAQTEQDQLEIVVSEATKRRNELRPKPVENEFNEALANFTE